MPRSLSVLLPVHNAQDSLAPLLAELLELLPDLTSRFEVMLIDDGSLDATMELAADLVARYPQVRVFGHPARLGTRIVAETGMRHAVGEWILYRDHETELDLQGIGRLWRHTAEFDCILARRAAGAPLGWIPRLPIGRTDMRPEHDGLILARRAVFSRWLETPQQQTFETFLARNQMAFHVVDVRTRPKTPASELVGAMSSRPRRRGEAALAGVGAGPAYLRRIKDFALGE